MQLSKFSSSTMDIITLYRSSNGNLQKLNQILNTLICSDKPILLLGDFNFCHLEFPLNNTRRFLQEKNFKELLNKPTHIAGNLLDQAHLRDPGGELICTATLQSKYYTDHKGLAIVIKRNSGNTNK